ncbi:IPExxxVDY family protein [Candidatus Ornithobacterium hominis]|uniref:IPExxxVDY family protein n=1 Tax=Candidatus Ornithobacterium hominis TaxID=2497989 RepID=UPI0024BC6293|nr:IPExxxVDY family protein [Candidatus Ornithobacterium hominis]CAI9429045.1 IPExxxVDY family protein [Candidatus Ornithobacterium hominis]
MSILLLDEIEEDEFLYYGIKFKTYPEYKLIYKINQALNFSFCREEDLDIRSNQEIFCYSVYTMNISFEEMKIYLIKNKSHNKKIYIENSLFSHINTSNFLFQRFKNFNYILKLDINLTQPHQIPLSLQSAGLAITVQEIDLLENEKKRLVL